MSINFMFGENMRISMYTYMYHVSSVWTFRNTNKHLKNVGPIRYCQPPLHCHSPGVATVARQL